MSQKLQDARRYEEENEKLIHKEDRPAFHLSPRVGWMNDPNGFSYYNGCYHLFYQYNPYDTHWGPMHWGHAVSGDLIHWKYLPAVMAPDRSYDSDGCYSGSTLELADGRQMIMYTGRHLIIDENGIEQEVQTQNLAFGDGVNYEKYDRNPVITGKDLPENGNPYAFRDPKIWKEQDGTYWVVIANEDLRDSGQVLLYKSDDCIHWTFVKTLMKNCGKLGLMWECPDFFPLDGKQVLISSAQGMLASGLEYHSGFGTFYFIGDYDAESYDFKPECNYAVDYGIDFYAPQTLFTPDGRCVMIGWMQNWETSSSKNEDLQFCGMMTLPRELSIRDGRLCQNPVREIEEYRGLKIDYYNVHISNETSLYGINGNCIDMTVTIKPGNEDHMYKWFRIYLGKDGEHYTFVRYRPDISTIKVDRTRCGFPHDIVNIREFPVRLIDGNLKIRFIIDRYSMEMFVNDGEQAASFVLYAPENAESISFYCEGSSVIDIEKYDLLKEE